MMATVSNISIHSHLDVLIMLDFQRGATDRAPRLGLDHAEMALRNARKIGSRVLHVFRQSTTTLDLVGEYMVPPPFQPKGDEAVHYRLGVSAFTAPHFLKSLGPQDKRILLATPLLCGAGLATVFAALDLGYSIRPILPACSSPQASSIAEDETFNSVPQLIRALPLLENYNNRFSLISTA